MADFYSQHYLPPLPPMDAGQIHMGMNSTWGTYFGEGNPPLGTGGYGPWAYGDRLYMLSETRYMDTGGNFFLENTYFNVFRSDDRGFTWAVKDSDNAPRYAQIGHFNPYHNKITVVCATSTFQLYDFDPVTDTWGEAYAFETDDPQLNLWGTFQRSLARANGNPCILFMAFILPAFSQLGLFITEWNGTIWTTPVLALYLQMGGGTGSYHAALLEPVSGNIHMLSRRGSFSSTDPPVSIPAALMHNVIHPDNTLGPETALWNPDIGIGYQEYPMPMAFFKGKLYVFHYATATPGYVATVGTPEGEPTSFTTVPVSGPIPETTFITGCALVTPDGETLHFLYSYDNPNAPGMEQLYSQEFHRAATTNGTAWSNTLYYDFWPQTWEYDHISAAYIGNGGIDGIFAFATTNNYDPVNTFYMLRNAGGGGRAITNKFY